jgi:hypothetical protein
MIDRRIIQEEYDQMSDEQLLAFANNEATKLTPDSFYILKKEFERRKLDAKIIDEADINRSLLDYNRQKANENTMALEINQVIWKYAMDQKEKGKTDSEIYNGLIAKRINPDYAFFIIKELEGRAESIIDDTDTEMVVGGFFIVGGIVLFFVKSSANLSDIYILYAFILIITGIVRLYISSNTKSKFKRILENIQTERIDQFYI